jgi:primosomal protein N' (replication factor Y)
MRDRQDKYYYEVSLALPAIWKKNIYTYSSTEQLEMGTIVKVPFGSVEKLGFVNKVISEPEFKTKPLSSSLNLKLPIESINLVEWMSAYYPGTPGTITQLFLPAILKSISSLKPVKSTDIASEDELVAPKLTDAQRNAYELLASKDSPKTQVLHGITGSGKTRLYCELATKYLSEGKNVLLLYPEISLTSQLEHTLKEFFDGNDLHTYHSMRKPTEQKRTWSAVHSKTGGQITIGPRSALFLPHQNLGLIIIDEAHDGAYKQDSGTRYNGIMVAGALSKLHGAKLILGSATPPVQETQQILSKNGSLVCMHSLARKELYGKKEFVVVDMREKQSKSTNHLLSKKLVDSIKQSIANKKQSLIFLNRRGTARLVLCENCGWHAECPNCDMPLTHHHDSFQLQCHVCGFHKPSMTFCPDCNSSLSLKNLGTKAIEEDLKSLFPDARVARFDSDNNKADSFSENYEKIRDGNIDIVLGTQLITKGLDLPSLETVGILQSDSALLLPDYSSEERAFQQLLQVSGRVGRGHGTGKVIVQTYQPESFIFKFILEEDWHGFYKQELEKRQASMYPPFAHAIKLWISKPSSKNAEQLASKFAIKIKSDDSSLRVLGPAPGFYGKNNGNYVWQIIIMSRTRNKLVKIAENLPAEFMYDLDPISLI